MDNQQLREIDKRIHEKIFGECFHEVIIVESRRSAYWACQACGIRLDDDWEEPQYSNCPIASRKVMLWLAGRYDFRLHGPIGKDANWHCGCEVRGHVRFPIDTSREGDIWTTAETPELAIALAAVEAIGNG